MSLAFLEVSVKYPGCVHSVFLADIHLQEALCCSELLIGLSELNRVAVPTLTFTIFKTSIVWEDTLKLGLPKTLYGSLVDKGLVIQTIQVSVSNLQIWDYYKWSIIAATLLLYFKHVCPLSHWAKL